MGPEALSATGLTPVATCNMIPAHTATAIHARMRPDAQIAAFAEPLTEGVIYIRCPRTELPASTGLTTQMVVFHSLPLVRVSMRCTRCGGQHIWTPAEAWIGKV